MRQIFLQCRNRLWVVFFWRNDKRIGQRVFIQHRADFLPAHCLLHFRQALLLAHKFHGLHALVFGEQFLHGFIVNGAGGRIHIQRDVGYIVELV